MAGAAMKKEIKKEVEARWGIWLNSSGTLTYGRGMSGETLLETADYEELKKIDAAGRVDALAKMKAPPPAPAAEVPAETPAAPVEAAPVEAAPAAEVTT